MIWSLARVLGFVAVVATMAFALGSRDDADA